MSTDTQAPVVCDWTAIDWSQHRRFAEVGSTRTNVVDIGEGPAVIFLHGLGGNWQNWLENLPALASDHRCIAVDLPGFGESALPADSVSVDYYALWVADLVRTLGLPSATLVGNSMGGQIAAEVALQTPELVDRLVLVDAAGISVESLKNERVVMLLQRADRLLAFWSTQIVARGWRLATRRRARRTLMSLWVANPDVLRPGLVTELAKGTGKPGFAAALKSVTSHRIRSRLTAISQPTLIVWGELDRITPVRDAYEFHAAIRGSRVVVWPDTGHLSMIERAQEFNELLRGFLSRPS
ncbi:MAG TPA: alpha/beta hydrolase [Baekduia sp.]|nr:alpha/beta hydrolase [Baekduia sp.]